MGASSRDLRGSAEVELAGDEPVLTATMETTPAELAEIPGGQEKLEALLGDSPLFQDPELRTMGEQIPLGRFTGLAGLPREQIQQLVDDVNAR